MNSIGMARRGPSHDGSYSFSFESAGLLSFTATSNGAKVVMSLRSHEKVYADVNELRSFLNLAEWHPSSSIPISAGLVNESYVLAATIPDSTFDLQLIETCLDHLINLHAKYKNKPKTAQNFI